MASLSDNQVIAASARAQERQGQFDGGQWNSWHSQPRTNYEGRLGICGFAGGVSMNQCGLTAAKFSMKGARTMIEEEEILICLRMSSVALSAQPFQFLRQKS